MRDGKYLYEMGVSYLMTEDYEQAISSFREILLHHSGSVPAIHNLKFALQEQGTATTKVLCPHCQTWIFADIFPPNTPSDIVLKSVFAQEFAEAPDSVRMNTCSKCHKDTVYTFALCLKCFKGWYHYFLAQINSQDRKKFYTQMAMDCMECGSKLTRRMHKTTNEIRIYDKLMIHRPQITDMIAHIQHLEKDLGGREEK